MEQCGHVEAKRDSVVVPSTKLKARTVSQVKTAGRLFSRGDNQPATHSPQRRELAGKVFHATENWPGSQNAHIFIPFSMMQRAGKVFHATENLA